MILVLTSHYSNLPKVVLILPDDPCAIHHVLTWTKCYALLILAKKDNVCMQQYGMELNH